MVRRERILARKRAARKLQLETVPESNTEEVALASNSQDIQDGSLENELQQEENDCRPSVNDRSSESECLLDLRGTTDTGEVSTSTVEVEPAPAAEQNCPQQSEACCQTDLTGADVEALIAECNARAKQVYTLEKDVLHLQMSKGSFQHSDKKVNFYTGLQNFACLLALYSLLETRVAHSELCRLQKFQEFLLFLMKLKWNFPYQDLAFRFNVSRATVGRIFDKWLHVSYRRLKSLLVWPERRLLQETMPQDFV